MKHPRFAIMIEAKPDTVPATTRLRRALKVLLRAFGLRCVEIREVPANGDEQTTAKEGTTA